MASVGDLVIVEKINGLGEPVKFGTQPGGPGGSGTVTSVALSLPPIFSVTGSPVTSAGTLTATLATQTQNLVWASPNGSSGAPVFRTLVAADIPSLLFSKITLSNTSRILGRVTAGSGVAEELTAAQVRTLINVANGATANSSDATLLNRANHTGTQAVTTTTFTTTARIAGRVTAGSGATEELTAAQVRTLLNVADGATANTGTVTSVALSLPSIFSVGGSPVTTSGTLAATLANQTQNLVWASPDGSTGTPVFRTLVAGDIPSLSPGKITLSATARILGRTTAGAGVAEELTAAQVRALLNVADGATANSSDATLLNRANHTGTQSITTTTFSTNARISGRTTAGAGAAEELTAAQVRSLINVADGATANSPDATLLSRTNHTGTQAVTTTTFTATARIAGRVTAGSGAAEELTAAQVRTLLNVADGATANTGTVTSVALSLPSIFSVGGSPVTTSGTLSATLATQSQNLVWASPDGSSGAPVFRTLVAGDIPSLGPGKITLSTTARILGRVTAGAGAAEELTAAQVRTLINVSDGATANASDSALRDRFTHTGVQPLSSVTVSGPGRIAGRTSAGAGELEEITIGGGLSLFGGVLSNTGTTGAAGSDTQIQVNITGGFGAYSNFTFDGFTLIAPSIYVTPGGTLSADTVQSIGGTVLTLRNTISGGSSRAEHYCQSGTNGVIWRAICQGQAGFSSLRMMDIQSHYKAPRFYDGTQWQDVYHTGLRQINDTGRKIVLADLGDAIYSAVTIDSDSVLGETIVDLMQKTGPGLVANSVSTPSSGRTRIYSRPAAGPVCPVYRTTANEEIRFGSDIATRRILAWQASAGVAAINAIGAPALSTQGVLSAFGYSSAFATPYYNTGQVEIFTATVSTTSVASFFLTTHHCSIGSNAGSRYGGFRFMVRVGPAFGIHAQHRFFMGLRNANASFTDVNPSTLTNMVGIGYDTADTNFHAIYAAGGGSTKTLMVKQSGGNFAKPNTGRSNMYDFYVWSLPGTNTVNFQMYSHSEDMWSNIVSTASNIPASTTGLAPCGYQSVGGVSSNVGFGLSKATLEMGY